ncbi:hypothetical protein F5X98DRAFT_31872 [Xylaria grammica]|nr:hypothetical protein F5X98DRAFT_31872 [Xylaria grammica]
MTGFQSTTYLLVVRYGLFRRRLSRQVLFVAFYRLLPIFITVPTVYLDGVPNLGSVVCPLTTAVAPITDHAYILRYLPPYKPSPVVHHPHPYCLGTFWRNAPPHSLTLPFLLELFSSFCCLSVYHLIIIDISRLTKINHARSLARSHPLAFALSTTNVQSRHRSF